MSKFVIFSRDNNFLSFFENLRISVGKPSLKFFVNFYLKVQSQVCDNFEQLKAFKNDEKLFFFHVKSSFRS